MPNLYSTILSQVAKYLKEHESDFGMDVGVMARKLYYRYPEYNRLKYKRFRAMVEQAYRNIEHFNTSGLESQPPTDDSDDSDVEEYMICEETHTNLTAAPASKQTSADVITIDSSDESSFEDPDKAQTNSTQSQQQMHPLTNEKEVPRITFKDIGGMDRIQYKLRETLMYIKSPDTYFVLRQMPPPSILVHGPPGCGKNLLANAIAGELNLPLIEISAHNIIANVACVSESEERIRDVFEQASYSAPCVLFFRNLEVIFSNEFMARMDFVCSIVSQLVRSLEGLKLRQDLKSVLVIAATTCPREVHPDLRSVGRFDHEIEIGMPNQKDRKDILTIICDGRSFEQKFDFDKVAELTSGFVGASLLVLAARASANAIARNHAKGIQAKAHKNNVIAELDDDAEGNGGGDNNISSKDTETVASATKSYITLDDFYEALKVVDPLKKHELSSIADDIIKDVMNVLKQIEEGKEPNELAEAFERSGLPAKYDIVLYGPPGCGQALLAKEIADITGMNFISVKGSALMNMNVGDSERAVRNYIQRARNSVPCVFFFDEFDSLFSERSETIEARSSTNLVNILLLELYGIEDRQGVYFFASTNRLDIIDPSILGPERLSRIMHIGLPTEDERKRILMETTENGTRPVLDIDVDISSLAASTNGYSASDLAVLVVKAAKLAEMDSGELCVHMEHFEQAIELLKSRNVMTNYSYRMQRV